LDSEASEAVRPRGWTTGSVGSNLFPLIVIAGMLDNEKGRNLRDGIEANTSVSKYTQEEIMFYIMVGSGSLASFITQRRIA
jgi:hypothetical protein